MRDWKEYRIGDLLILEYGKALTDYRDGVGKFDVFGTNGQIGLTDKFLYDKPSLIIGRKGAYREVHFAKNPFFVIDTAFYTKNKTEDTDTTFMYYWFKNIDINSMDSGSAIPSTSRDEVYDLEISLPSFSEQTAIAEVLSSLDDKIDLLHRQNKTLEQLAETLFSQWFVEEAEDLEETTLDELVFFDPREKIRRDKPYQFFDMKCLSNTDMNIDQGIERIVSSASSFRNFDTLLAKITPCLENGKTGFVMQLKEDEVARGSTEFIVMRSKGNVSPYWIYCLATDSDFREKAIQSMTGTSGRQRVQIDLLRGIEVKHNSTKMNEFHENVEPYFMKIKSNQTQIRTLTQLRDTLLPKLMSGEVRVK